MIEAMVWYGVSGVVFAFYSIAAAKGVKEMLTGDITDKLAVIVILAGIAAVWPLALVLGGIQLRREKIEALDKKVRG